MRIALVMKPKMISLGVALALALLMASGCAVRRQTRIHPSLVPPPAREATVAELVAQVNSRSDAIRTLSATVDLEPTAGSIYSGVIKEYHDVKGFVLAEKPAWIRMIGQAPVVRTNIFDMTSDGRDFRLYIPSKQKFIVGRTDFRRPAKNALENLRPQHILEALLVPPFDASQEKCFQEEAEEGGHRYYVVSIVAPQNDGELTLRRKIWFDRANLEIARVQFYERGGSHIEDVRYADYQDFQGIRYPTRIELSRPVEDYQLAITVLKATFNQPIEREKFELKKPEGAQLVDLSAAAQQESPRGQ